MNAEPAGVAATKVMVVWTAAIYGISDFPIAKAVLWVTFAYTLLQLYKLARDLVRDHRKAKAESKAFAEKITAPEDR